MGSHHGHNTLSVLQVSVLEKMRVAQCIMDAGWIKVKIKDMLLGSAMVPHARHGFHPTFLKFSPDCRRISWMSHVRDDTDMLRWSYFSAQRHGPSGLHNDDDDDDDYDDDDNWWGDLYRPWLLIQQTRSTQAGGYELLEGSFFLTMRHKTWMFYLIVYFISRSEH